MLGNWKLTDWLKSFADPPIKCQNLCTIHPQFSYVENAVKLTKMVHFDLCLFLQCSAVCVWSLYHAMTMYQLQMTRQGVEETEACISWLSLCCSAHLFTAAVYMSCCRHFVWCSTHVVGPWLSLGPGPVLYPATACHMDPVSLESKSSKFLSASFSMSLPVCAPWHWLWLGCTENCWISVPSRESPWTMTCKVVYLHLQLKCKILQILFLGEITIQSTPQPSGSNLQNCGTQCRWTNMCAVVDSAEK